MRIRRSIHTAALVTASAIFLSATAEAQERAAVSDTGRFCFRGAPEPRCRWFLILEASVLHYVATTRTQPNPVYGATFEDFTNRLDFGLGAMKNIGPRRARGIVLSGAPSGSSFNESATMLEWRERQWSKTGKSAMEVSLGILQKPVIALETGAQLRANSTSASGITASTSVSVRDLFGVTVRGDLLYSRGDAHRGAAIGVKSGSHATAILGMLYVALMAVAQASFAGG